MTADQQLDALRKMAAQHPRTGLSKALRELSARNAVHDMTERLRAEIGLRRAAVRLMAVAGSTEGLV